MTNIIFIVPQNGEEPGNEKFTANEHLEYILSLSEDVWRRILRHENPRKMSNKVKHPPLSDLSEDDLRRKLTLALENRLDGVLEARSYTIISEEDESNDRPDIVVRIKTKKLNISLDIECKKSSNNKSSSKEYRENGVNRFTSNQYDKGGCDVGGMIAFAINSKTSPLDTIIQMLRESSDHERLDIVPTEFDGSQKFVTTHKRDATHKTITLQHLILNTN